MRPTRFFPTLFDIYRWHVLVLMAENHTKSQSVTYINKILEMRCQGLGGPIG